MKKPTNSGGSSLREQLQRGDVLAADCPSRAVLEHVTSRWGTLVLISLQSGTLRFSDLRRKISVVSEKMLAQTLKQLERDGFVQRRAYEVVPPHVEYSLTELGREVADRVEALTDWIERNLGRVLAAREAAPQRAEPQAKADHHQAV